MTTGSTLFRILGITAVAGSAGGKFPAPPVTAATFYVSPLGNDAWSGQLAEPNIESTDGPFATLERAREALRTAPPDQPRTVILRGGVYRLAQTLELGPEDSGTAQAPVVWRAAPGEEVRLIGGLVLTDFQPVTDPAVVERLDPSARGNILQANLKDYGLTDFGAAWPVTFRGYAGWPELFFDGQPMALARWPNEGMARVAQVVDSGSKPRWNEKPDRPGTFVYEGDRPTRWGAADEVYLNGYWAYKWYNECIRVARIDPEAKTITFAAPHLYGLGGPSGGEYFALNLLEELDSPGEYYLDRKTGILYFWPPEPWAGQEVGLSLLETPLARLANAAFVIFRDLIFEFSRSVAVVIEGGHDNLIAGCTVRNIALDAVTVSGGSHHGVVACDLYNLGAGSISLNGGDRATLTPGGHYAENNHIHHYGRLFRTHRDAIYLNGVGCRASHNLIHDAPHHAIDFGGNDHLIEFNEIHHVCLETDDAGAIYTGRNWTVRGTVIRFNYFHDIGGGTAVGNQAIYLDDTACGTTCQGNVIENVYRAFLIGGGRDNVVENNLVVGCPIPLHIDNRGLGGEWLEGQEVYLKLRNDLKEVPYQKEPWRSRYPTLANILEEEPGLPKGNVVRRNIFFRCGGMYLAAEARQYGTIEDNWETEDDPGCQDAAHGNFSVRPDAPAFQQVPGFQAIPFDQIGLVRDEYRRTVAAATPWIEPAVPGFVGEMTVTLGSRTRDAVIYYTLDGSEPALASERYTTPFRLTATATVKAAAFAPDGEIKSRSGTVSATFQQFQLGPQGGVYLSDLPAVEVRAHGGLTRDACYYGGPLKLSGQEYAKGLMLHPEATPEGGVARATYVLEGGLSQAQRFLATIGLADPVNERSSVTFAVEVHRHGAWERVFESGVLRAGQQQGVAVDIAGANRLRLVTTDAGDGIDTDHAVWAEARLQ